MEEMYEGVRIVTHSPDRYTAEVVMNAVVVWARGGYRSYGDAKKDADRELSRRKQRVDR